MKKILVILLAITLASSFLTACGGGTEAKEPEDQKINEDYIVPVEMTYDMIIKASSNKAAAAELNDGRYYKFLAKVLRIEEDYAVVSFTDGYFSPIVDSSKLCAFVYFKPELLTNLYEGQTVEVSGKITDVFESTSDNGFGGTVKGNGLEVTDAYAQVRFELTGELLGWNEASYDNPSLCDINCGGDQYVISLTYYDDMSRYEKYFGKEVKINAYIINGYYTDAQIEEVL